MHSQRVLIISKIKSILKTVTLTQSISALTIIADNFWKFVKLLQTQLITLKSSFAQTPSNLPMIYLKMSTRNLMLLRRNLSAKLLENLSNQGVHQAVDANTTQLEPLQAEAVEMEAEAEEVDFTQTVEMEEMVGTMAMVVVEEMTMTTVITVMMIPMMMETLQIHVVTTCVSLLLHRPHLHLPHLSLTCVTSPDLSLKESTLRSFHHKIHLKLFCQTFHINSTVATSLLESLIIEKKFDS